MLNLIYRATACQRPILRNSWFQSSSNKTFDSGFGTRGRRFANKLLPPYGSINTASNALPTTSSGVMPVATASVVVSKKSISPPWIT